jgi:uncharacterized protein (TIGR03067 family)
MKTLLGFIISAALASACLAADEAGFKPLFNGKDLTGWEGRPEHWSVEDGAITGKTTKEHPAKGNNFLIWRPDGKNGTVSDFELRLSYKIVPNNDKGFGNSGIQYRSKDFGNFVVGGYQADFEAGKTYSGILYEERMDGILAQRGQKTVVKTVDGKAKVEVVGKLGDSKEIQSKIKDQDWNDYVVIAKGNHFQHFINGVQTVDVTDEREAPKGAKEGVLALQLHAGEPMTVQFKDIRIKNLGGESAAGGLLKKLTGKWVPTEATYNGEPVGRETLDTVMLTIDGQNYTSKYRERTSEGTISIDESKTPATMDMLRKRSNGETQTIPAILEFKDDTLRVCYAYGENPTRPTEFKSEADSGRVVVTYKRD